MVKRTPHYYRSNDSSPLLSNLRVMLQKCESRYRISNRTGVSEKWMSKFINDQFVRPDAKNVETLLVYFGLRAAPMSELLSDPEKV